MAAFVRFDRNYQEFVSELQPAHVQQWDALIAAYEKDKTLPDPYHWKPSGEFWNHVEASRADVLDTGLSEADIRVQLAKEEEADADAGNVALHEVTPSTMVATLLDLEEQQYVLRCVTPSTVILT